MSENNTETQETQHQDKPKKRTRKKRSKNRDYEQSTARPSVCTKCGSTNRDNYFGSPIVRNFDCVMTRPDGMKFNRLVKRRTRCADCGQYRFDLAYEFDPTLTTHLTAAPAFINQVSQSSIDE